MPAHRIRLAGPWEFTWEGDQTEISPRSAQGTVTVPVDWRTLFGDVAGRATFRRKFHRPTNLETHERVILVLTEVRGRGTVLLNEVLLGEFSASGEAFEFEATRFLKPFNTVSVQLAFDPQEAPSLPGGLYAPVAIDIRSD